MKHTKGPWRTIGETMVYGPDDYCVAVTRSDHWVSCRDIDECLANARLIAAAPSMLSAIEAYLNLDVNCSQQEDLAALSKLKAVINWAKGGMTPEGIDHI